MACNSRSLHIALRCGDGWSEHHRAQFSGPIRHFSLRKPSHCILRVQNYTNATCQSLSHRITQERGTNGFNNTLSPGARAHLHNPRPQHRPLKSLRLPNRIRNHTVAAPRRAPHIRRNQIQHDGRTDGRNRAPQPPSHPTGSGGRSASTGSR